MPENADFFLMRQEAIERMRKMSRASGASGPAAMPFVEKRNTPDGARDNHPHTPGTPQNRQKARQPHNPRENVNGGRRRQQPHVPGGFLGDIFSSLGLSFGGGKGGEGGGDITLLLALLLLLSDDGCDRILLYALIYILL